MQYGRCRNLRNTADDYFSQIVNLISDIGGQIGLFLGEFHDFYLCPSVVSWQFGVATSIPKNQSNLDPSGTFVVFSTEVYFRIA